MKKRKGNASPSPAESIFVELDNNDPSTDTGTTNPVFLDEVSYQLDAIANQSADVVLRLASSKTLFASLCNNDSPLIPDEATVIKLVNSFQVCSLPLFHSLILITLILMANSILAKSRESNGSCKYPIFSLELFRSIIRSFELCNGSKSGLVTPHLQSPWKTPPGSRESGPRTPEVNATAGIEPKFRQKRKFSAPDTSTPIKISPKVESLKTVWPELNNILFHNQPNISIEVECTHLLTIFCLAFLRTWNTQTLMKNEAEDSEEVSLNSFVSGQAEMFFTESKDLNAFGLYFFKNLMANLAELSNDFERKEDASVEKHRASFASCSLSCELLELFCFNNLSHQDFVASYASNSIAAGHFGRRTPTELLPILMKSLQIMGPRFLMDLSVTGRGVSVSSEDHALSRIAILTNLPAIEESESFVFLNFLSQVIRSILSFTNKCKSSVEKIVSATTLEWLSNFLYLMLLWRKSLSSQGNSNSSEYFRLFADTILYVVSLLINVVEVLSAHIDCFHRSFKHWLGYEVSASIQSFPSLQKCIPQKDSRLLSGGQLSYLLGSLLKLILEETSVFMSDLFTYELQGSSTKESSVAPPETGKSLEKGTEAPEEVPVDEIITSAYLVLLVHAIVFGEITGDQVSKPYLLPNMNALACFVCSRLPKNNFWLFIRVLKAFLALQGGCGLLNDFYLPCVFVVANLQHQNEQIDEKQLAQFADESTAIADFLSNNLQTGLSGPRLLRQTDQSPDSPQLKRGDEGQSGDWLFSDKPDDTQVASRGHQLGRSFSQKSATSSVSSQADFNFSIHYDAASSSKAGPAATTSQQSTGRGGSTEDKSLSTSKRKFSSFGGGGSYSLNWS